MEEHSVNIRLTVGSDLTECDYAITSIIQSSPIPNNGLTQDIIESVSYREINNSAKYRLLKEYF